MNDAATEVAALEQDVANSAASAEAAAESAAVAVVAAQVLTEQVQQAEQAAAAAVVEQVQETARETEWNTERLERLQTQVTELSATVMPLQATLESLMAAVQTLTKVHSSADSPSSEVVTPNPSSESADALPAADANLPTESAVPEASQEKPPAKEKRFRLMR